MDVRRHCIWTLRFRGKEPELLPHYIRLLDRPEWELWVEAAHAIEAYGPKAKDAVPSLLKALADRDKRRAAAQAIAAIGDRSAVPQLIESLKRRNAAAARVLGRLKAASATPALIEALRMSDLYVPAAWALGEIGSKEAAPALLEAIRNHGLTFDAAVAHKKITGALPPWVWKRLTECLDRDYHAGSHIGTLAASGDEDFAPLIIECLDGRWSGRAAAAALERLTGQKLGQDYTAWRMWLERKRRGGAEPRKAPGFDALLGSLHSDDPTAVTRSVVSLGQLGDVRAVSALESLYARLPDHAHALRAETLRALARLGKRRAVARLIQLTADQAVPDQKVAVLKRFEGLSDERALDFLYEPEHSDAQILREILRLARPSLRMKGMFGKDFYLGVVASAEEALFDPEDAGLWREAAETLAAIFGLRLLPGAEESPETARRRAQRRWAAFAVGEVVRVVREDPREAESPHAQGRDYAQAGGRANQAFLWLDERGRRYTPELMPLLTDTRPLGTQTFTVPMCYDCYFVHAPTLADLALRALTICKRGNHLIRRDRPSPRPAWFTREERLPEHPDVRRYYLERIASAAKRALPETSPASPSETDDRARWHHSGSRSPEEAEANRVVAVLARMDGAETTSMLVHAWSRSKDPSAREQLEHALAGRPLSELEAAYTKLYDRKDREKRARAVCFLTNCVLSATLAPKKREYARSHIVDHAMDGTAIFRPALETKLREELELEMRDRLVPIAIDAIGLGGDARLWATGIAGRLKIRQLVPKLIEALKHDDQQLRGAAIRSLGQLAAHEAAPHILVFLDGKEPDERLAAIRALADLKAAASVGKLRELLADQDSRIAAQAARALALLNDRDSASAVLALLDREPMTKPDLRLIVEAAGILKIREAVPHLVRIAKDRSKGLFEPAVEALGRIGTPEVLEILKGPLRNTTTSSQTRARLLAIGRIDGSEARRLCRSVIDDRSDHEMIVAAEGLALVGDRMGYDLLVELLSTNRWRWARAALVRLVGQDFGPFVKSSRFVTGTEWEKLLAERAEAIRKWREWWQKNRESFGTEFDE